LSRSSNLEVLFPGLDQNNYRVSSSRDVQYNCIAFAAGVIDEWWWPDSQNQCAWPDGVPRQETIEAFVQAYATLGYRECRSIKREKDFEKVALFAKDGKPTHAARMKSDGEWLSQLGGLEDIHHELNAVCGDTYGSVVKILRRPWDPAAYRRKLLVRGGIVFAVIAITSLAVAMISL